MRGDRIVAEHPVVILTQLLHKARPVIKSLTRDKICTWSPIYSTLHLMQ